MKAEERHELETNTLAATITKAVSTAKTTESSQWIYAIVIALVALVVWFLVNRYLATRAAELGQKWMEILDGSRSLLEKNAKESKSNVPGKVAQLQQTWTRFWDYGLKKLAADPDGARIELETLATQYEDVRNIVKGDPIFEPETLYALAVIEETQTIFDKDRKRLDTALEKYRDIVSKFPKSAQAAISQPWIEKLENSESRKQVEKFYDDLHLNLVPGAPRIPVPVDPIFEPKKK